MPPSWCYHHKKSSTVLPYQLDTSNLMLHSQCYIAESKEMVHNTTSNALRFLVKLERRNKHVVRKNSKWWKEKMVPAILMHKHYHQDASVLMLPSWYDHPEATILKPLWDFMCMLPAILLFGKRSWVIFYNQIFMINHATKQHFTPRHNLEK